MAGPERLADFLDAHRSLRVTCQKCGHVKAFKKDEALKLFGNRATALSIERKMRCSTCGSKRCAAGSDRVAGHSGHGGGGSVQTAVDG